MLSRQSPMYGAVLYAWTKNPIRGELPANDVPVQPPAGSLEPNADFWPVLDGRANHAAHPARIVLRHRLSRRQDEDSRGDAFSVRQQQPRIRKIRTIGLHAVTAG